MATQHSSQIHIGRIIAQRRAERGLTQDQLGERLDIGSEAVSRIERGTVDVSVSKLLQIADIFECNVAELLTDASSRPDDQTQKIKSQIDSLPEADRVLIVDLVDRLVAHLKTR